MDYADFASPTVRGSGTRLTVTHGGDENLLVSFYSEPVLQTHESEQQGRPIYKDTPFVWIRFPGDRTREVRRKATGEYRQRFARQWADYERQTISVPDGTPLEEWGPLSKSQALMFKGVHVHTVEQLASVPDSSLQNLGHGGRTLRDKAIAWLKTSKDSSETMRLAAENQSLRDDIELLKQQMAEFGSKRKPKKGEDE
jgi:hypothetical protein